MKEVTFLAEMVDNVVVAGLYDEDIMQVRVI